MNLKTRTMDIKQNTKTLPTSLVEWLKDLLENNKFCSPTAEDFLQPLKIAEKVAGSLKESGLLTKKGTINSKVLNLYLTESLPCMEEGDLRQLYENPARFFCHVGTNRPQSFVSFIGSKSRNEVFSVSNILSKNAELMLYFMKQTNGQSVFAIDTGADFQLYLDEYNNEKREECCIIEEEIFDEEY